MIYTQNELKTCYTFGAIAVALLPLCCSFSRSLISTNTCAVIHPITVMNVMSAIQRTQRAHSRKSRTKMAAISQIQARHCKQLLKRIKRTSQGSVSIEYVSCNKNFVPDMAKPGQNHDSKARQQQECPLEHDLKVSLQQGLYPWQHS